jgi:putative tricarboxylic transport membrane protein
MKITNGKDFWAGLMFISFGMGFLLVAIGPPAFLVELVAGQFDYKLEYGYQMGSSVRMGPAYFPAVLGGMLAVLGAVIFLRGFVSKIENPVRVFPFRPWYLLVGLVLGVVAYYTQTSREASIALEIGHTVLAGLAVLLLFAAFGERSLWVVLFSVVIFGYMLKPLGLVIATGLIIFVSAWGGHEFKVKEVTILFVILAVFSVLAFVKGLGLPMNVWPGIWE